MNRRRCCSRSAGRPAHSIPSTRAASTCPVIRHSGPVDSGAVLVHGDFGPQNMIFDVPTGTVAAVVDWELAQLGEPVTDLAWCEWIVRTHHPRLTAALPHLYDGYGRAATLAGAPGGHAGEMRMGTGLRPALGRRRDGDRDVAAADRDDRGLHAVADRGPGTKDGSRPR